MLPWSVIAHAGIPSWATFFASCSGRLAPSRSEYSVWRCRWTKDDIPVYRSLVSAARDLAHASVQLGVRSPVASFSTIRRETGNWRPDPNSSTPANYRPDPYELANSQRSGVDGALVVTDHN